MLAGLVAALVLVADTGSDQYLAERHGVIMVLGFLGTLIALERAIALRRRWAYVAPAMLGAGGLALATPIPPAIGHAFLLVGTLASVAVLSALWQRQRDEATAVQILGASAAVVASLLLVRLDVATVVSWLAAFVVLTIAAERLELARLTLPPGAGLRLLGLASILYAGLVASLLWPTVGARLVGLTLIVLVAWLARIDVARRTIRAAGLPRFSAAALLLGYGWLALAAAAWAIGGAPRHAAAYDLVIHATFVGFAISMVMAHAPVILPSVLKRPLPYRRALWWPLALLHAGLVLRVLVGDGIRLLRLAQGAEDGQMASWIHTCWQLGSWLTVAAILLFGAVAVASTRRQPEQMLVSGRGTASRQGA